MKNKIQKVDSRYVEHFSLKVVPHIYKAKRLEDDVEVTGYYIMNKVRPQPEYDLYDSNQVHHYIETQYGDRYEIKPETLMEA